MNFTRIGLTLAGLVLCLVGLVWVAQGTGYFPFPERSIMINQMPWAYRGAAVVALGVVVLFIGRVPRRRSGRRLS